ncbi:Os09g0501825, partial [Oryza sativa Japonica Group]
PGKLVGDDNVKLSSALHYLLAFLRGHIMSNFSTLHTCCAS